MELDFSTIKGDINHASIQDEEALFLYSLVRANRINRILELGGGAGKSSLNFLKAMEHDKDSVLYTVDITEQVKLGENHVTITRDCNYLVPSDVDNKPLGLIFFDCHTVIPQLNLYNILKRNNLITEETIIVLHDTNLYYEPYLTTDCEVGYPKESLIYDSENDGFAHQWVERQMVNYFKLEGYDIFSIRTKKESHTKDFPYRNGISVCQKFSPMKPYYLVY